MEIAAFHPWSPRSHFIAYALNSTLPFVPKNYVHWVETPESHLYSADIPGVRREEVSVEVEDSRYLIIRAESTEDPSRSFHRKFRLPGQVDVDGISAEYAAGVLKVTVPRSFVRRGFFIDPADVSPDTNFLARAA
ncbi:15.4 kDa class V heat shock protein [Andrographis paniculata]|uniref:15.4 kDa class V heat shock protein n=1 Tax=Andrographis paniculata TaxID=175694 RepID=UPI0021E872CF|nr:15.4 kDa class V heat shock protein [Andrographis paniculata]